MSDLGAMTYEELILARDLGAAMHMSAYVHMMARQLGIDDTDQVAVNDMALQMVDPVNVAVEACWRGMMSDPERDRVLERFCALVKEL